MNKTKIISIILAFLFLEFSALADTIKLDQKSIIELAIKNNQEIKVAAKEVEIARYQLAEAKGYRFGKISAVYEYDHLNDPIELQVPTIILPIVPGGYKINLPPFELSPQDVHQAELTAGFPLFTGGQLSNYIAQADAGLKAKNSIYEDVCNQVVAQVNEQYLAVLLTRDALHANEEALSSYNRHWEEAKKIYKQGLIAEYDVIKAETMVREQEKKTTEALNRYKLSQLVLKNSLSLDLSVEVEVSGNFFDVGKDIDLEKSIAISEKNNPLLKALKYKEEAANAALQAQQGALLPQVYAIGKYEMDTNSLPVTDPRWVVGVNASMPIFDGFTNYNKIKQKQATADKAVIENLSIKDQIVLAINSAYLDMNLGSANLKQTKQALVLAQEGLRMAEKRFAVGVGTGTDVTDANTSLLAARVGVAQAYYQLDVGYLKLQRWLGSLAKIDEKVRS